MESLSSKIIERIKKENVAPKPRWYFLIIQGALALAFMISIVLGSIGVAIVIRHFTVTDWEMARHFAGSHFRTFFLILPYLWLVIISLMILLSESLLKHTKKGYRVSSWKFVALSIGLSVFFGGICYFAEADRPLEEGLRSNFGPYAMLKELEDDIFVAPERGVLAGRILSIHPNQEWVVIDLRNMKWLVDTRSARMKENFPVKAGIPVGMIGMVTSENHFKAERIGLWKRFILPPPPPIIIIRPNN